ncbi:hypothetical protein A9Q99_22855 [Gammaproteobacteria bacterium 45_16_T64]|nr:hypothetical protein A9Q99_22855 [Gammaproteobacteria bacterium 45_16_T64]
MKLHGAIISPNVRKVIIACMIKDINFESNMIIPGPALKEPEFLKINPLGQIPALEDEGLIIGDSNVILQYLEEKHPEIPILPESPAARAKSRWLSEYAGAALFPCCATIFREAFVNPNYFKQPTNQEAIDETTNEKFPPVLDYLQSQITDDDFIFGTQLSTADISICSMFITASYGGFAIDADRWPTLAAYVDRIRSHPVVIQCLEAEKSMLKMITG